jgi:tRNA(adenine34) deaminase
MSEAIELAKIAYSNNEVPVGAVVILDGEIIGRGFNQVIELNSVIEHAEIIAIREASKKVKNYRLINAALFSTLEPCHMCAKAIIDARIKNLVFATPEPKTGAIVSVDNFFDKKFHNHRVIYSYGLMSGESSELLKGFFRERRALRIRN